jgi:ferric-dicitrate binding protein FerR (iron transport regulator)
MEVQANGRHRGKSIALIALLIVTFIWGFVPESQFTRFRSLIDPSSVRPIEGTYATQLGAQLRTPLPDRSLVTQNVSTVLRTRISPLQRRLTLQSGEMLADIAPDTSRPFVIQAGEWSVSASSGTVWVKALDSNALRVGVLSNSAEVRRDDGGISKVELRAGDIATFTPDSIHFEPSSLEDLARQTAWRRNQIWLSSDTLADAVREFNRYSERKIVINDRWTAAIKITGRYFARGVDKFIRGLRPLLIESRPLARGPRSPDVVLLSTMSCVARPMQPMTIRDTAECNKHVADGTPPVVQSEEREQRYADEQGEVGEQRYVRDRRNQGEKRDDRRLRQHDEQRSSPVKRP